MNPIDFLKIKVAIQKIYAEDGVFSYIIDDKDLNCTVLFVGNCFLYGWENCLKFIDNLNEICGLTFEFPNLPDFKLIYNSQKFRHTIRELNCAYGVYLNANIYVEFDYKKDLEIFKNPNCRMMTNSIMCVLKDDL